MPATHVLPLVPPLLLPPELDPPELLPPELEPPELDPPELDEDSPQKKDLFTFPQAVSPDAQTPSMHAAARYESPLEQSQHVGLQSANVVQEEPPDFVPVSFSGLDGQPPFTCSPCDETFDDELDPDEDEEEEDEEDEEPDGFVPSALPPTSVPLAPEQAARRKRAEEAMRQADFMRPRSAIVVPRRRLHERRDFVMLAPRARATLAQSIAPAVRSTRMVHAPGAGRGPLPIPVAIGFVLIGPLLLWFSYKAATEDPKPVILSCTRESAEVIACQPGNARGAQAIARTQTGKNAKTCFTLGDKWLNCGGDVQGAAARVNALPVGAKADVDLTPAKESVPSMLVGVGLAVMMIVLGLHRLFKGAR